LTIVERVQAKVAEVVVDAGGSASSGEMAFCHELVGRGAAAPELGDDHQPPPGTDAGPSG